MIIISIALTTVLSVVGFVSAALSAVVFKDKKVRRIGCGQYLFASSIVSLLLVIIFLLRIWLLIFAQLSLITNRSLLYIHCLSVDVTLSIFVSMSSWFNAFVTIDRAINAFRGIDFNKKASRKTASWNIVLLTLLLMGTNLHDPINRRLVDDEEEKRAWCVVQYSPLMQTVNSIITTCHFLIPFIINIIGTFVIIHGVIRKRSNATKLSYQKQLYKQFQ